MVRGLPGLAEPPRDRGPGQVSLCGDPFCFPAGRARPDLSLDPATPGCGCNPRQRASPRVSRWERPAAAGNTSSFRIWNRGKAGAAVGEAPQGGIHRQEDLMGRSGLSLPHTPYGGGQRGQGRKFSFSKEKLERTLPGKVPRSGRPLLSALPPSCQKDF